MTDRRRIGLLLVAVVFLVAVAVPIAAGRPIAGVAQSAPVPQAPTVGQCVGQKFDAGWNVIGGDASKYVYPGLVVGDCGRAHYAEVVAVIRQPTTPKVSVEANVYSVDDKNLDTCFEAARIYQQGDAAPATPTPLFGYWVLTGDVSAVPLAPTTRQRTAGQHWLACVTYLPDVSTENLESPVAYQGSLRGSRSTGVGRDYLGDCPDQVDWNNMSFSGCSYPHHGEVFGSDALPATTSRAALTASCARLVAEVTRNADLARDGHLSVSVQATNSNGETVVGPTVPAASSIQCGVVTVGARVLTGSLIAIATAPIPWG